MEVRKQSRLYLASEPVYLEGNCVCCYWHIKLIVIKQSFKNSFLKGCTNSEEPCLKQRR